MDVQKYHRPWGSFEVLADEESYKIKRIVVSPLHRLSLQRHFRRSEHWYLVTGQASATCNTTAVFLTRGQSIDIPRLAWHRIMNTGTIDLVFIEVQTGDYFGEDDIERAEDDYGRP